jgi:transcriptional regulator with XRE-family HTH domain
VGSRVLWGEQTAPCVSDEGTKTMLESDKPARATFAGLVKQARQAAWLTQEELAERSGLSPRTIQAIERGQVRRPHRDSVRLLATALGLTGDALVTFEDAARPTAGGPHRCPSIAELAGQLAHQLKTSPTYLHRVDLTGLGATADPVVVLARVLTALGVERYGLAGSEVSIHTLPVQVLPGA